MKYRIIKTVNCVQGWQSFLVDADSEEHAEHVFNTSGGELEEEELEVHSFRDGCEISLVEYKDNS